MIDLSDISHVVSFWFLDGSRHGQDFLAAVFQDKVGQWRATYRFRYFGDQDPFSEKDVKNWYELQAKTDATDPRAELTAAMDAAADRLLAFDYCERGEFYRVSVDGDVELALQRLAEQPWFNMRVEDAAGNVMRPASA